MKHDVILAIQWHTDVSRIINSFHLKYVQLLLFFLFSINFPNVILLTVKLPHNFTHPRKIIEHTAFIIESVLLIHLQPTQVDRTNYAWSHWSLWDCVRFVFVAGLQSVMYCWSVGFIMRRSLMFNKNCTHLK